MPTIKIAASFWRGGTSRGLILRAKDLVEYNSIQRDKIILTALGSPDPSGRQISGLGGGVSSLSKCCLIGSPSEGKEGKYYNQLPGLSWADDGKKEGKPNWDVVYRFAQVPIRDTNLDWSSTCGNMLAAVSLTSISSSIIPYSTIFNRARLIPTPIVGEPLLLPISILSASTGDVFKIKVPLNPSTLEIWEPLPGKGCTIAGVPGELAPGVIIELPLAEGGGLMTGKAKDVISFEGMEIPISILSTGLPNIFVPIKSIKLTPSQFSSSLSKLTSDPNLSPLLERLRIQVANQFKLNLSLSSPKIILVSSMPLKGYVTSADITINQDEADIMVRAISSGDFHATIPGTTLSALNLGLGIEGTVIHDIVTSNSNNNNSKTIGEAQDNVVSIRAGHAAGVTSSSLKFVDGKPESVVMLRTGREIMRGEILIPHSELDL